MENNSPRVISISKIKALAHQESTQSQRINLTPHDLGQLLLAPIQRGLLYHKPILNSSQSKNFIEHLKSTLSRTLDFFFPLAGRLATATDHDNSNTVSFFIDCNNAGAEFAHAIAENVTVSDILEPIYVPDIVPNMFFPLNGVVNYDGVSYPLLAVQVTELVDGVFIGLAINHSVADGAAFWNFVNSWSEISRKTYHNDNNLNDQIISKPPVIEHWFRNCSYSVIKIPLSLIETDHRDDPPMLKKRIFHFSKENILGLKEKANIEAKVDNNNNKISSLQSVIAHIWKSLTLNRNLDPQEDTFYCLPIGVRSRFDPPIPETYFGNATQAGVVTMKARDILKSGIGYIAREMNKMIERCTEENVRNNLEDWIKNPNLIKLAHGISRKVMLASSLMRFDVYGNDFGWGKPIAVRSGHGNRFDGLIAVYPGPEQGSLDVEVCVLHDVLQAMGSDSQFMDFVTL
ncbi:protein ENHANCED PSEUDOMONAS SUSCEPTIBILITY 1-like [Mercurialis annua]|uniref:protein ENHANCED PSEUDOMONAS SUSCEPTIBILITY 1-like n=1 Tax=Mercurialis annua TaxID=3986 RepID=UPI00215FD43F|nr:protein ENHANCED PSEUDOMONAS SUSCEPTIBILITY 1-like [Mercurialis annua]